MNLLILLLFASTIEAAPGLSWESCVEQATRNNAELRAAQASLDATAELVGVGRSGFLPQLSASVGYNRGNTLGNGADELYSASFTGSQNLFSGLQDLG